MHHAWSRLRDYIKHFHDISPLNSLTHLKVLQYFEGFIKHQWNTDLLRVWCVAVDHDVNVSRRIFPVSKNGKCTLVL